MGDITNPSLLLLSGRSPPRSFINAFFLCGGGAISSSLEIICSLSFSLPPAVQLFGQKKHCMPSSSRVGFHPPLQPVFFPEGETIFYAGAGLALRNRPSFGPFPPCSCLRPSRSFCLLFDVYVADPFPPRGLSFFIPFRIGEEWNRGLRFGGGGTYVCFAGSKHPLSTPLSLSDKVISIVFGRPPPRAVRLPVKRIGHTILWERPPDHQHTVSLLRFPNYTPPYHKAPHDRDLNNEICTQSPKTPLHCGPVGLFSSILILP